MTELSMLESQSVELLPAREALQGAGSINLSIFATNTALALPQDEGDANADAHQTVVAILSAEED